jgi:tRNA A-37 threonylcarbamoyl transferase component Bud32
MDDFPRAPLLRGSVPVRSFISCTKWRGEPIELGDCLDVRFGMIKFRASMAGEMFGSYRVVALLGKGGMGEVFLAEHQHISRRAAIKVLRADLTADPALVHRFFIEARATSLIRHPGIVEVFDCDVLPNGRVYMVMEYLEGETLADRLARVGPLGCEVACAIGRQIAAAMQAAHRMGILHRDLKPENVFLAARPDSPDVKTVKILDFGIAKLLANETPSDSLTVTGIAMGSPKYMSPEQCSGSANIDSKADIYSLGCLLFEAICGRVPFERASTREILYAHMFRPAPAASSVAPSIPAWLDGLIERMLAKNAGDRPDDMAEVARILERGDTGSIAVAGPPDPDRQPRRARRARRKLGIRGGIGLGTAAIAAAIIAVLGLSGRDAAPLGARDQARAVTPTAAAARAAIDDEDRSAGHLSAALTDRTDLSAAGVPVNPTQPAASNRRAAGSAAARPGARPRAAPPVGKGHRMKIDTDGIVDL